MADHLRHLIHRALALLLLAAAVATAPAQDTPARPVTLSICTLDDSPLWTQLHLLTPGDRAPVKINLRGNQRSQPVRLRRTGDPIVLGVPRTDPATGAITYAPVARCDWPGDARQVLVILAAGPAADLPARAVACDDGTDAFPARSVRVFNATGAALIGKIDRYHGPVPPGMSASHAYAVASDNPNRIGTFPLAFAIDDPASGPRLLTDTVGEAWPYGRSLVFLLPPLPGATDLQLRIIVDAPPAPKPRTNP